LRLLPPLAVRLLSELTPCELVRVQMQGDEPTLAIAALDEKGERQLICLDVAQTAQGALPPPVFVSGQSGRSVAVICLGKDYAFVPANLAHAQAHPSTDGRLNGALLVGPSGAFLRVHGKIGGSTDTRYLDIAKGSIVSSIPDPEATFYFPAWSIRWTNAEVLRHLQEPLFSFALVA